MEIPKMNGSNSYIGSVSNKEATVETIQNPYTFYGNMINSSANNSEPAPVASSKSLQHPDVERRLKEAGWNFGVLDYNQFGGIPLIIPSDANITKEAITFPSWFTQAMNKYLNELSSQGADLEQTNDALEKAVESNTQYVDVTDDIDVSYKEQLPRLFMAELELYNTLKEKTGYDYPGLLSYLEYRKELIDIL